MEDDAPVQLLKSMGVDDALAEVALLCTRNPETVEQIAERNQVPADKIREQIVKLGENGVLFFEDKEDGQRYYNRVPWAPGICEHCLTKPSMRNLEVAKYFDMTGFKSGVIGAAKAPVGAGFMHVIPIGRSIDAQTKTVTYEEIQT